MKTCEYMYISNYVVCTCSSAFTMSEICLPDNKHNIHERLALLQNTRSNVAISYRYVCKSTLIETWHGFFTQYLHTMNDLQNFKRRLVRKIVRWIFLFVDMRNLSDIYYCISLTVYRHHSHTRRNYPDKVKWLALIVVLFYYRLPWKKTSHAYESYSTIQTIRIRRMTSEEETLILLESLKVWLNALCFL